MTLLIVSTLLTLVVLPLLMLVWLMQRSTGLIGWSLKAIAVGSYVMATYYFGAWQMLSYGARSLLLGLLAAAALVGAWRMRGQPVWNPSSGWSLLWPVFGGLVLLISTWMLVGVYQAHRVPEPPVDLHAPLRGGPFHIVSGGSHSLMNPHMKVTAPGLHAWRGQRWALDIVELYPSGNRARGLYPTDLERYAIFGEPLYAPCAGRVAAIEDGLPDLVPPATDTTNKAGNYVMLRCGPEAYVLLAHLQQGSVAVAPGDTVAVGARLGAIGNSGNTSEPHLHLHVQRAAGDRTLLDADPRPLTINGRFLVRNDLLEASTPYSHPALHGARRPEHTASICIL
jgi:hypothetical protein